MPHCVEWWGYLAVMICSAVSTEYEHVTDRQTDRQTNRHLATA